ncbi:MAG: 3-hydroxyacyl-CoA dehydrogenase NAD-binding domain-containing protein, partial [Planctomycetota bacterium]
LDEQVAGAAVKALVVRSAKKDSFIVGADIDELARIRDENDARAKSEAGKAVFARLAALSLPTVAVIHGACLGGGLELALACRYRVVTDHPKTSLGVPEVNLGIIPGWGGTLRLPRLVGLPQALTMICTGKPLKGRRAYKAGLADAIAAAPFVEDATRRFIDQILTRKGAAEVGKRRRRAQPRIMRLLAATPPTRALIYRQTARQILKRTKGHYPAPLEALGAVRAAFGRGAPPRDTSAETDAFARLVCTPISRNLLWLFQAGQRMKKTGASGDAPVARAGVVGAGIMGSGIAWAFSNAGLAVRLRDVDWDAVGRGMGAAAAAFRALVKRRKMTKGQMNLAMHRIAPAVDYTGFGDVDVVVEAVAEDLEVKKKVLREIEQHVRPDTIIATNTSSLSVAELADCLDRPQRFVGLHFFNPVNRMPLVEVVAEKRTSHETVVAATALMRRMDKIPMVVSDCAGFLVNRILLPYLIESTWMFEEGADARRIDGLLEAFGMPMGPLALVDEVGLDIGYKVAKVLETAYGSRMHVPEALGAVAGTPDCLGRKTGCGFYRYRNGGKKPNRRVARLARQARRTDGVTARQLTDDEIVDRAILIMVNEAARCLQEHVVDDPAQLDMAMVMGTGFAPFRGGLLRYADERGVTDIKERLDQLAEQFGDRFKAAALLEEIADNGGHFHHEEGPSA